MTQAAKMFRLDFMSMKVYLRSYLLFLAYPILFAWWEPVGMAVMGGMMLAMLGGSIFSVQEKNKLERLYGMLAITPAGLVAGRYLFLMANCLLVQVVMLPVHILAGRIAGRNWEMNNFLFALGLSYLLFWVLAALQTPLYFKYGYTKMRMWVALPFMLIALGTTLLSSTITERFPAVLAALEAFFTGVLTAPATALAFCLLAGTMLALLSYVVSIRTYLSTRV